MKTRFAASVLVVDDSESVASLICEGLREVVSEVKVAETGRRAIDLLSSEVFSLILLDHRLPDMTGVDVIASLAERGIIVPFVTITGHGDEKVAVEMMKLGAYDYLIKDEHLLDLLPSVVCRVLKQLETELRLKAAEEELVTEELRYRELFDHMSSRVAVLAAVDENGDDFEYLDFNRAGSRASGLEKHQVVGRRLSEIFPGTVDEAWAAFREVWKTGRPQLLPEVYNADGRMDGCWRFYIYKLPSQEIVVIGDDISEQKRAEEALREGERRYRELYNEFQTLLDGIPDFLSLLDADLKVVWCNRSFAEHFGRPAQDLHQHHCYRIWHDADAPCDDCPVRQCFATGETQEGLRRFGDRVYGVKAFPLRDEEGRTVNVINICSEVTEKIRLREEAAQSSRLASLGELAAGVAHEINNPNALILLNSPLLEEIWSSAAPILAGHYREKGDFTLGRMPYSRVRSEVPRLQAEIGEAARRIKTIVDDLKNFVRRSDGDMHEVVDLNAVAEKAVRLVNAAIRKATFRFRAEYHPDLPPVKGHFGRLEQVVVNLLLNACQALPAPERGVALATRFDAVRRLVVLEVRDEGVGIAPENLPRLTDPFFTTRRESGGTGLGLSVSARIAEEHGGTLKFASESGAGTVVSLTLSAVVPPADRSG